MRSYGIFPYKWNFVRKLSVYLYDKQKYMETARVDIRLRKEQKELFEETALSGGFQSLTHFIISAVQEKVNIIQEQRKTILASEKDKEIFFNALMNPPKPNDKLKAAAKLYKQAIRK